MVLQTTDSKDKSTANVRYHEIVFEHRENESKYWILTRVSADSHADDMLSLVLERNVATESTILNTKCKNNICREVKLSVSGIQAYADHAINSQLKPGQKSKQSLFLTQLTCCTGPMAGESRSRLACRRAVATIVQERQR